MARTILSALGLTLASLFAFDAVAVAAEPAASGEAAQCRSDLPRTAPDDAANPKALARLELEMKQRHIPGLQAALVRHGEIVMLASCGLADIAFAEPVRRTNRFQLASATKPFTGVALMQLVEEGKVRLDDPLSAYLDDLPDAWRAVTVRQALMHVTGLPDIVDPATGNLIDPGGMDASWARVKMAPTQFAPGQGYAYNQTNYLLLGRVIEKLRGQPFTEVVRQREFQVAGMATATFSDSYVVVPGRATAYALRTMVDGRTVPSDTPAPTFFNYPQGLRTGAGLTASAEEVARWLIALRSDKLLKPATRQDMWTTGKMPDGRPTAWALGWPAFPQNLHPAVAGIGGGSVAFYWYPADDMGIVILTNLAGADPQWFISEVAKLYRPDTAR